MYARLLSRLMQPHVMSKRMMRLVLLPVPQVKRWQQHTFPDMLSLPVSTQPRLSSIPLIPLMLNRPSSRNVNGNIVICSSCQVGQGPFGGEKSDEDWWPAGL